MGWTVLYIAFGIVALWLLGEVLLQYKARLRWRLVAFFGFLCVVLGVLLPSILVIAVGTVAFATGQLFVTLSFRRGFSTGWALGGGPGSSRRRREEGADGMRPLDPVDGGTGGYGTSGPYAESGHPDSAYGEGPYEQTGYEESAYPGDGYAAHREEAYAEETHQEQPQPAGYSAGAYTEGYPGAYPEYAGAEASPAAPYADSRYTAQHEQPAHAEYPGYPDGTQQPYGGAYQEPYTPAHGARGPEHEQGYSSYSGVYGDGTGAPYDGDHLSGHSYGDGQGHGQWSAAPAYYQETPPGGVWMPQQREPAAPGTEYGQAAPEQYPYQMYPGPAGQGYYDEQGYWRGTGHS